MKRRQLLFAILKGAAVGMFAGRYATAQEDLDPVKMMPDTHKVVFENAFVRVIEGRVPAGGSEPKHRHPHCVMVNLADFDAEVRTFPDGEWKRATPCFRDRHLERGDRARDQDRGKRAVAHDAYRIKGLNPADRLLSFGRTAVDEKPARRDRQRYAAENRLHYRLFQRFAMS